METSQKIKEYRLAGDDERTGNLGTENGIEPVCLEASGREEKVGTLTHTRLLSHLYYMIVRSRKGDKVGKERKRQ